MATSGKTSLSLRPVSADERDELDSIKDRLLTLEVKEGSAAAIADGSITNAKLSDMAQATVKGRASGAGTGAPQDLTASQLNAIVGSTDLFNPSSTVTLGASSDEGRGQTGTPLPLKVKGSSLLLYRESADTQPPNFEFLKRRSGTGTVLQSGDMLGSIVWTGADGNTFGAIGAIIRAEVDGTPGSTDMPGRIIFLTTPDGSGTPAESFRINSGQNLIMADGKRIEADEIRARDSGGLLLRDNSGNLGLIVTDGGNVYVGGDTPQVAHQFDVLGDTSGTNQVIFGVGNLNTTDPSIYFQAGNGVAAMNSRRNHPLVLRVNNIDRMRIDTSGNVGIGTDNPGARLQLDGTNSDAGGLRIRSTVSTADRFALFAAGSSSVGFKKMNANAFLVFYDSSDNIEMTLDSSGRLGVGVASPQGKLHGHDGTGGFGHFTKTGIVGSTQTIIPDGVGDVTKGGTIIGSASTTDGTINMSLFNAILNGVNTDISPDGGTNIIRFSVSAGGALTVIRQAGTKTWEISIWAVWR